MDQYASQSLTVWASKYPLRWTNRGNNSIGVTSQHKQLSSGAFRKKVVTTSALTACMRNYCQRLQPRLFGWMRHFCSRVRSKGLFNKAEMKEIPRTSWLHHLILNRTQRAFIKPSFRLRCRNDWWCNPRAQAYKCSRAQKHWPKDEVNKHNRILTFISNVKMLR